MNPKYLLEAMNDIDYTMVEEAENMMNRQKSRIPRSKKTVLIAAAVAVLLCITAAAAGLLWMKPEVHVGDNKHSLVLRDSYITLPEESEQTILAAYTPEKLSVEIDFASVEEWQAFYGIPLVMSSHFTPYGTVGSAVSALEIDGNIDFGMMISFVKVAHSREINGEIQKDWIGSLKVTALIDDDKKGIGTHTREFNEEGNAEIVMEFTTDAGIPCVISRIANDIEAYPVTLLLHYGYESVLYEFELKAVSAEEETTYLEYLKTYADTIQIYPITQSQE